MVTTSGQMVTTSGEVAKSNSVFPVITGRFVVAAALLSVFVLLMPVDPWLGLLVGDGALLAVSIVDWILTPAPSSIGIERGIPLRTTLHAPSQLTWIVSSSINRRMHIGLADTLMPSLRPNRRRVRFWVPSQGRVEIGTEFQPQRRGRFELSTVTVRVFGPIGFMGRQGRHDLFDEIRVYPSFRSREEAELRINRARILEVGNRSVRSRGGGTDFDQLRDYTVDDDFRRMDWSATARVGKPVVREYRAEQNQNVVVLLDTGRVMAGLVDGVTRLEHTMDAALTVTAVASRLGDKVGLIAFDSTVRAEVASQQGTMQFGRVSDAIYGLEPELAESNYREAFVHTMSRFRRRSLVVLLTELSEHAVAENLIPAMPLLARSHLVLIGSVSDPDVESWSRAVPTELNRVYRKAAAATALTNRSRTTAVLRSKGATVIDSRPGGLAASVADAYLHAKATGRL